MNEEEERKLWIFGRNLYLYIMERIDREEDFDLNFEQADKIASACEELAAKLLKETMK